MEPITIKVDDNGVVSYWLGDIELRANFFTWQSRTRTYPVELLGPMNRPFVLEQDGVTLVSAPGDWVLRVNGKYEVLTKDEFTTQIIPLAR